MGTRIHDHLRHNLVGYIALFVALSSSAVALSRNSVGSRELDKNAVKSKHIKNKKVKNKDVKPGDLTSNRIANNTLREVDIKPNGLTGNVLKNDSLGGGQINENSLETVPEAQSAGNLDGTHDLEKLRFRASRGTPQTKVLSLPGAGLEIHAACNDLGFGFAEMELLADSDTSDALIAGATVNHSRSHDDQGHLNDDHESLSYANTTFDSNETQTLLPKNLDGATRQNTRGFFTFTDRNGAVVSATYVTAVGTGGPCEVYGNVLIG